MFKEKSVTCRKIIIKTNERDVRAINQRILSLHNDIFTANDSINDGDDRISNSPLLRELQVNATVLRTELDILVKYLDRVCKERNPQND